jgi:predicted adenylyl cyclase CyaB
MKNLELKIFVNNFRDVVNRLKKIGAEHSGTLNQKDVYYKVSGGRLKTREINGTDFELIFYNRANTKSSKFSNYQILNFSENEFKILAGILNNVFDIKSVVEKKRELWLFKHTRVHLDKVKGLGNFLELETVMKNINLAKVTKEHKEVIKLLDLNKYKKQSKSYSDLL